MKQVVKTLDAILGPVERSFALIAGVIIMVLMAVVTVEVISRTAFNHPVRGNLDIVEQLMVLLVSLGVAYCQSQFGNVRMTLVTNSLKGRAKWLSEAFALLIAGFVVAVLVRGSWAHFQRSWTNGGDTPELGIPLWIGILVVTGTLGLLLARICVQLLEALRLVGAPASGSVIFDQAANAVDAIIYE